MGLDMYLERKTYVKNYDHTPADRKTTVAVIRNDKLIIKPSNVSYIVEEVAYWRKANQIHAWFVKNCMNGEDDNGGDHGVSTDQLRELLGLVNTVLEASKLVPGKVTNGYSYSNGKKEPILEEGKLIEDSRIAEDLLPTQSGFFFGSTDYDEYYLADLIETKKQLEPLLAEESDGDYFYSCSW